MERVCLETRCSWFADCKFAGHRNRLKKLAEQEAVVRLSVYCPEVMVQKRMNRALKKKQRLHDAALRGMFKFFNQY